MAAVLRDEFGGFEAVRSKNYAVAVLLEHATDEFTNTDGIVRYDDHALVMNPVDGVSRNAAFCNGSRAWGENAGRPGACLNGFTLARFRGDHAIQIEQKNQAPVRSDSRAGAKFYAVEGIQVGTDDVETNAASRELGF